MSRDKTKWVSQMISAKTRKMLEEICQKTRRSVPTELEIIVEEAHNKSRK
tara:strand:- start:324 stop:473 length:150 start_codon:yes stop_codon:yes gene_type:complete